MLLANMGYPLISIVWPPALLTLPLVVGLEAAMERWIVSVPPRQALLASAIANGVSTVVGIPVAWVLVLLVQVVAGDALGRVVPVEFLSVATVLEGVAMLPPNVELWQLGLAAALLCLPFAVLSFAVEWRLLMWMTRGARPAMRKWAAWGNSVTYGIGAFAFLAWGFGLV